MGGLNLTPVVKNLLILNIGVYLIQLLYGPFMENYMALHAFQSALFQPWQLFTHMFMHSTQDFSHILFNMIGLVMFGSILETFWGPKKFLFYYMACGLGAALIQSGISYYEIHQMQIAADHFNFSPDPVALNEFVKNHTNINFYTSQSEFIEGYRTHADNSGYIESAKQLFNGVFEGNKTYRTMVGASGAIYGLLLAFGMLFPNTELMMIFVPIPIKAKYFVIIYGALELYLGFGRIQGDSVAHFAHIGGMLFGYILIKYWQKQRNSFY
jgi:membrane associated rhomboid family serine protease